MFTKRKSSWNYVMNSSSNYNNIICKMIVAVISSKNTNVYQPLLVVSFMKKTGQGFMFFLIGKIFGAPRSNWKWCQINVYSWWLCKVCQSRSFSDLHFMGVGARWAEWASIMVIWVVEFSREGYKIRNILGQKLISPKETIVFCDLTVDLQLTY